MAEYNFWDDRTYENNYDNYCPVICWYCFDQKCNECNDYKEFCDFYGMIGGADDGK